MRLLCRLVPWAVIFSIAFVVFVVLWFGSLPRQDRSQIAVTLESPQAGTCQLFYDTGDGFKADQVANLMFQNAGDTKICRFYLPAATFSAIRFDPPDGGGVFLIHSIALLDPYGAVVREFPLQAFVPNGDIQSATVEPDGLVLTVAPGRPDPFIVLRLDPPLVLEPFDNGAVRSCGYGAIAGLSAVLVAWLLKRLGVVSRAGAILSAIARRCTIPGFLPLDNIAVGYYLSVLLFFLMMSAFELHGSSMSIHALNFDSDRMEVERPLLGMPRGIRVDEWNHQTPAILFQLARANPLKLSGGVSGPDKAAIIACIPTRHFSTVFHPQFWPFFVFSRDLAFATYWQMKSLILLGGTFTLFLMLTRSSKLALFGALWFYFSPYTQWCFSWPCGLPEMIGSFCFAVVFACRTLTAPTLRAGILAALAGAFFGLNFVLLPYPPFQIPFVWSGVAIMGGYVWIHHAAIRTRLRPHLFCFALMLGLVLLVTGIFLYDIRGIYAIAAQTVYPGRRSSSGGREPFACVQLFSNFIDLAKTEINCPYQLDNICEASGYYWLAPIALLLATKVRSLAHPAAKMFVVLWFPFFLLAAWILLPIPAIVGRPLLMNMVLSNRCLPALGLVNIALVLLFLGFNFNSWPKPELPRRQWRWLFPFGVVLFTWVLTTAVLLVVNEALDGYFPISTILGLSLLTALMIVCLAHRMTGTLMFLIVLPNFAAFALANPVDRGFKYFDKAPLAALVQSHTLKPGKWLVYSGGWLPGPSTVSAYGINVFNYFHHIPDLPAMATFDPEGRYKNLYNQVGYMLTYPDLPGTAPRFFSPSSGALVWHIAPTDPRLGQVGIRYVAFYGKPEAAMVPPDHLRPIADHAFDGIWVYERLDP